VHFLFHKEAGHGNRNKLGDGSCGSVIPVGGSKGVVYKNVAVLRKGLCQLVPLFRIA